MASLYRSGPKRGLDLLLALILLVPLAPLLLLLGLWVRLSMGSPVLFRQQRPGLGGQLFTMFKFRTMNDATDPQGRPLPDEQRLTRAGALLRRWSLDELPELFKVLRGEMSLIGPRPLIREYLERYSPEQARRHEVRPGITGWAQVNGRNAISWEEKFRLDVWYVDHLSLWLDLRILVRTIGQVLGGQGVAAEGHATMPEFMGSREKEWNS